MVSKSNPQIDEQAQAFRVQLGNRLRSMRATLEFTQEQAAEAAGISQSALSMYEGGRAAIPAETLIAIANAYHVQLENLLIS